MWQTDREGHVPADALPVGTTREGERLYVGRVFHDGTLTPGKVNMLIFLETMLFLLPSFCDVLIVERNPQTRSYCSGMKAVCGSDVTDSPSKGRAGSLP
jgi:hypothetical protein